MRSSDSSESTWPLMCSMVRPVSLQCAMCARAWIEPEEP